MPNKAMRASALITTTVTNKTVAQTTRSISAEQNLRSRDGGFHGGGVKEFF